MARIASGLLVASTTISDCPGGSHSVVQATRIDDHARASQAGTNLPSREISQSQSHPRPEC
jgi:hypothetical protein